MPAPVMPLRKCLITLLQAKINMGKLHRPALHCNAMHCTALHCTAHMFTVKDRLASSLSNLALFILAQECLPL